jgi:hypothetical protein
MIDNDFRLIKPEYDEVIEIPKKYLHLFYGYDDIVFAGMAPPANQPNDMSGLLTLDYGATTTVTKEWLGMPNRDVKPKVVTIQFAMSGATMKSTHVGIQTYYVYDRTGTLQPISTKSILCQGAESGFIGRQ